MQKTKFSKINDQFNKLLFGFLSSSWKSKSINIISVLTGYFLFANFATKFISEGRNELIMVPVIILIIEFIIIGVNTAIETYCNPSWINLGNCLGIILDNGKNLDAYVNIPDKNIIGQII